MNLEACLQRIGCRVCRPPDLPCLEMLQLGFLLHVPFENLDIHLGRPIRMETEALYQKIVRERRGGFCYELNGLFHDLLSQLGFQVDFLSARMSGEHGFGPEFDHMVLLVHLEHDYLVDVGNGRSCRQPLPLGGNRLSRAEGLEYRIGDFEGGPALMYRREGSSERWSPRYLFTIGPRQREEFGRMCHYHQTSPDSVFTRKRLVTLARTQGRVTLEERELLIVERGHSRRRQIKSEREWQGCLREHFGIELEGGPARRQSRARGL